ncbi:hypothetical protein BDV24DRAFT_139227 [Aspergillus arachidicola]|uniref:Uncharacterized protein n=1 Tax=Aspergillus arachidicola TaxID=656916 RepID=A0A5N6XZS8_9EURO|nr:hypothetical protein BDV24DRAFT_139227 [Aspergillus arachidicola]
MFGSRRDRLLQLHQSDDFLLLVDLISVDILFVFNYTSSFLIHEIKRAKPQGSQHKLYLSRLSFMHNN